MSDSLPIKHILYTSIIAPGIDEQMLLQLFVQSANKNKQTEITGIILVKDQYIYHFLEGEPESIDHLYAYIKTDNRHTDVTKLTTGYSELRVFPDLNFQPIFDHTPKSIIMNHLSICEDLDLKAILLGIFVRKDSLNLQSC